MNLEKAIAEIEWLERLYLLLDTERNLRAEAGKAGGNPQAGRRGAKAWHPDGAGSIHPASGDAGAAAAVGLGVIRAQLWFSTGTLCTSSGSSSATVHRRRLRLGD